MYKLTIILSCVCIARSLDLNKNKFPDDFLFGTATSAYQIEGAWNVNGKGESQWDHITHTYPNSIIDKSTGDIACDSYHKYKEDVQLIVNLGLDFYRFSFAWTRILPTGKTDIVNEDGIQYYNNLINELLKYNITPIVTLYHWDMPMDFMRDPDEQKNGFLNEAFPDMFEPYAALAFETFGDRVKYWITFNEPDKCCDYGIYPSYAIDLQYKCNRNLLRAHAKAYHLYDKQYREKQKGIIGIVIDSDWNEAASEKQEDIDAAERYLQFELGIWTHPLYIGDYPPVVKEYISMVSKAQNLTESRLPTLSPSEIKEIKGTNDFFGFNHYTSKVVSYMKYDISKHSRENDASVFSMQPDTWEGPTNHSKWLKKRPQGFRYCLKWIKDNCGDPAIYVMENGYSDLGEMEDAGRVDYYQTYMSAMLDAMFTDKVNVKGYAAWSLLDNFEWLEGYASKFGLHSVNFSDPKRPRTQKLSAKIYKEIVANRKLVNSSSILISSCICLFLSAILFIV